MNFNVMAARYVFAYEGPSAFCDYQLIAPGPKLVVDVVVVKVEYLLSRSLSQPEFLPISCRTKTTLLGSAGFGPSLTLYLALNTVLAFVFEGCYVSPART